MSGTTGTIPLNAVVADQLITSAERNAELANIGTLMDASGCGGHSDTDPDAQIQTAPYPGSVLSKATSIAGELERLRYQLAQVLGTDYWYKPAATDLTSVGSVVVPVGACIDYPTNTAPNASWHLADGTAISRAAYPALFTLIGTTFGVGNGTTTFNLPDYRDRMSIGAGTSYAAAATGGEATHILTNAELPATGVTVNITDPGHTHLENVATGGGGESRIQEFAGTGTKTTIQTSANGTTGITAAGTIQGSGTAHNNLPPYLGMYKLIRIL